MKSFGIIILGTLIGTACVDQGANDEIETTGEVNGKADGASAVSVDGFFKDTDGALKIQLTDGYGSPNGKIVVVPTTTRARNYIGNFRAARSELFTCRLTGTSNGRPINPQDLTLDGQTYRVSDIRCVADALAYRVETSESRDRDTEVIYDGIAGRAVVVEENYLYTVTVKEDAINSCERFTGKDGSYSITSTCLVNRKDPLTGIVHSLLR